MILLDTNKVLSNNLSTSLVRLYYNIVYIKNKIDIHVLFKY